MVHIWHHYIKMQQHILILYFFLHNRIACTYIIIVQLVAMQLFSNSTVLIAYGIAIFSNCTLKANNLGSHPSATNNDIISRE